MELKPYNINKNLKYNHITPVELDSIPKEELEQALIEFSEGSKGLEKTLKVMWSHGLKTIACCAGEENYFNIGYICMEKGINVFEYLSEELILNEFIALEDGEMQIIRFARDKENILYHLANDILSGKKDNKKIIKLKINSTFSQKWYEEQKQYYINNKILEKIERKK